MSDTRTVEAEVVREERSLPPEAHTQALTTRIERNAMAVGQALTVAEIIAQVKLIQDVMRSVMKEGEHYGTIPGCGDKKTLLQPGAQKLTMTFRLAPEYQIQEVNLERGHKEYRVICTLRSIASGSFVGQGVGCCSSMESKYRWRGGARKCPVCGKEAIIMGKKFKPTDPEPGWLCWKKKDGCGATWAKDDPVIAGQSVEKVENENPADTFNTVLKIAKKRAYVDATITATAASDIFTQDIGDDEGGPPESENQTPPPKSAKTAGKPAPSNVPEPEQEGSFESASKEPTKAPASPGANTAPTQAKTERKCGGPKARDWMIAQFGLQVELAQDFAVQAGKILPNETLKELPFRWVPISQTELESLIESMEAYARGGEAKWPWPAHEEPEPAAKATASTQAPTKPIEVPRDTKPAQQASDLPAEIASIIVPVPRKGQKRDEYLKHPDTIGSLYAGRHDDEECRRRLFGFMNHFEAKRWGGPDGNKNPPSEADKKFRDALDKLAAFIEETHPEEVSDS